MSNRVVRRRKPVLSEHQKQIRFFTRLSLVICCLFTFAFFWFLNRPSFVTR